MKSLGPIFRSTGKFKAAGIWLAEQKAYHRREDGLLAYQVQHNLSPARLDPVLEQGDTLPNA